MSKVNRRQRHGQEKKTAEKKQVENEEKKKTEKLEEDRLMWERFKRWSDEAALSRAKDEERRRKEAEKVMTDWATGKEPTMLNAQQAQDVMAVMHGTMREPMQRYGTGTAMGYGFLRT